MHRSVATRILTLLLAVVLSSAWLSAEGDEERAVSIRIHDYANINDGELAEAQEVVSEVYSGIGVRTDWLDSLQQVEGSVDSIGSSVSGPSHLKIIILTAAMANRGVIPDAIIGFAAVERGVGGQVAYVIYDRVKDFASDTHVDEMRMMGIVMAHEIGHLLLAHQSHSDRGLMRGRWQQSEFRSGRPAELHFSEPQVLEIRRTLGGEPAPSGSSRSQDGE